MKKITLIIVVFTTLFSVNAQVLNESADWPNSNWSITGTYDATYLYEDPTTTSSNFSFDDDDANSGSNNDLAAESPVINLTNAFNAGEIWISMDTDYVLNIFQTETLTIQYWDADTSQWENWSNVYDTSTAGAPNQNFCSGPFVSLNHPILNIAAFSENQLTNFRYRIYYQDNTSWGWGFCITSPVLTSAAPPTCPEPINLNAINITETTADLQWTENGTASLWNLEWGPAGFTPSTGTMVNGLTSTIYNLTGLSQGVTYDFYVQADCGGGDTSSLVGPFNFITSAPGATCSSAFNISVNVDCNSAAPTSFDFSIATDIDANNENPTCDGSGNYGYFISFQAPAIGSVVVRFSGAANSIGLEVYDSCGGNSVSTCTNNDFNSGDSSGEITGLTPGNTYYAVIWRDQQNGTADICIEQGSTCPSPSNLNASSVTIDSATLNWVESGSAPAWNLEWGTSGFTLGTGTAINDLSATSYALSALSSGTSYDFYVLANCGSETSNFTGPFTFTTQSPARINFDPQPITVSGTYDMAIVDMDGDFLDDIVTVSASNINIQKQNSDGSFTNINIATPNANFLPSWSIAAADFDANGKTDLLYGAGSGVSFMQASNDGMSFTQQATTQYTFSQRSNFVDINNDGNLDAFVCHDVEPNVYFINDGTGNLTFYQSDITTGAPYSLGNFPSGGDYGSIWIDYNNDRNIDLFIAKCGGSEERRTNMMLTNNGNDSYSENAAAIGLADPMQTWSSAWGDFDNDGDMDVFVGASSGDHKLMRNNGFTDDGNPNNDYTFTDVTIGAGVSTAPTGWESSAFDIDNDGFLDIIANGTILYGKGDLTFEDADPNQINYKNGAFGDLNNDGFIDAFYNGIRYYNQGNSNNWVKINTVGNVSNINGIGARVEVHTPNGVQIRDVRSGEGFEFMSSLNTHFGLGSETQIDNIIIYWPSGIIDNIPNPTSNTTHNIIEGAFLSVDDETIADFTVYPNPVDDVLNINSINDLSEGVVTIFDIQGKVVLNQKHEIDKLDVSNLEAGIYVLRLENQEKLSIQKFVKK